MVVFSLLTVVAASLGVMYLGFASRAKRMPCQQMKLVFARVVVVLGGLGLAGASAMGLRAAPPPEQADEHAVGESLIERYTELSVLLSADPSEPAAEDDIAAEEPVPDGDATDNQTANMEAAADDAIGSGEGTPAHFAGFESNHEALDEPLRPEWVGETFHNKGSGEHWISVSSGPWLTDVEAQQALEENIYEAVANYIDDQIGRRGAARRIGLGIDEIRRQRLVVERYAETRDFSVGEMQLKHAKLMFTPHFRSQIAERWKEHLVTTRLVKTGVGIAAVMVGLFIAFGVLKRIGAAVS